MVHHLYDAMQLTNQSSKIGTCRFSYYIILSGPGRAPSSGRLETSLPDHSCIRAGWDLGTKVPGDPGGRHWRVRMRKIIPSPKGKGACTVHPSLRPSVPVPEDLAVTLAAAAIAYHRPAIVHGVQNFFVFFLFSKKN